MTDIDQLVIVGIDGLDVQKTQQWNPELLLSEYNELDLSDFDELKTSIIWPTMYAGETPFERGFSEPDAYPEQRAKWSNPALDVLSRVGSTIVPREYRRKIGSILASSGAELTDIESDKPTRDLFEGDCVFSALKSRVIEVPGWNKREMDIKFNSGKAWRVVVDDDKGVDRFIEAIEEESSIKTELTIDAMGKPYELVWVHMHFVDSVSHFFGPSTQQDWYQVASDCLGEIQEAADERTEIAVVSDHGLGKHGHREPGLIAVENTDLTPLPDRPREIRGWIETQLAEQVEYNETTMETLDELGYRV